MRTIPIYLLALIVAIANTPTDVYQICAWNHGTEQTEPWRAKLSETPIVRRAIAIGRRVKEWCTELASVPLVAQLAGERGEAALDLLAPGANRLLGQRKQLDQKAKDIHARLLALNDKAAAAVLDEKAPQLTDDERAEVTKLKGQFEEISKLLGEANRLNEAERTFTIVRPDPDAQAQRGARGETLEAGLSAEEKMAKAPGFFGRFLHSVRRVAVHEASAEDHKIIKLMAGPTGANTDVPSEGGFLIAPERSNIIIQRAYDTGAISSLVTRLPIGPNSNGIVLPAIDETSRADGSRFGGIASGWVGQGTTTTAGKPKFRLMEMKLRKLLAFVYGTDELNADAVAFEAWVNQNLPKELMFRVEDAIVNGDGSNKPVGLLNSGAAITVTRNTVTRVLYEDVSGMWKRMWAPLRSTAVWLADQSIEQELEQMSITIGAGGVLAPIYRPAGVGVTVDGTQGYFPATLYGRPIITHEYGAALGTVGDLILTNLGEYTLIDKGGVDQAVSLHVAFLTDEAVYRFTYRADGQLNWNAPLTPKSGGATLSPVVTLT